MKKLFIFTVFLLAALVSSAQKDNSFYQFPEDWIGDWSGTLYVYGVDSIKMEVPMSLEIQPIDSTDRYTWGLTYASKKEDWRPYELVSVNKTLGLWQIDEKNSIIIEGYQRGNAFVSWFVVQENRVLCRYERTVKGLEFEVIAGTESPVSVTGNTKYQGEDIPEVKTYPAPTFQKAVLKKG